MDLPAAASRLAARQLGLITRRQCLGFGMTERQIDSRVAGGGLLRVHRGVYRVAAVPGLSEQVLLAACMAARPGAVASHRSAAIVFGLRGIEWGKPEITIAAGRRPDLRGVIVHRSPLPAADVGMRGPVPVTRPGRTLLDLAAVEPALVEGAFDDALVRGLTTLGSVKRTLDRTGGTGRAGTSLLRALVAARAAGQASTESPLEDRLVALLRRHGLPEPVRQHEVTMPGGGVARLDLTYPDARLAIEADGRVWHSGRVDFTRDRRRANRLVALGWTLLRYGRADLDRGAGIADEVAGLLDSKAG